MGHRPEKKKETGLSEFGVIAPPDIQVDCPTFSGSLATLFVCVRERKIDLLGIPLAPICTAYLRYLRETSEGDVDATATAMAALAYLLERKAWLLLPQDEEEPDDDDILLAIEPYVAEFAPAIERLKELQAERDAVFFRNVDDRNYALPFELSEVTPDQLASALEQLLAKASPDNFESVTAPRRSLQEQMALVMQRLTDEPTPIELLVELPITRLDAVYWFLALLELIRLGQAKVTFTNEQVLFARRPHEAS